MAPARIPGAEKNVRVVMKESFAVSVIIPVFNNWGLTRQCLSSLAENSPPNMEVIVVDNGSSDETACELVPLGQSLFGAHFQRIRFEENRNFAPVFFKANAVMRGPGRLRRMFSFFSIMTPLFCPDGWLHCWRNSQSRPGWERQVHCFFMKMEPYSIWELPSGQKAG